MRGLPTVEFKQRGVCEIGFSSLTTQRSLAQEETILMIGIQIAYLFNTHGDGGKMFRACFSAARGQVAFQCVALNTPSLSACSILVDFGHR